MYAVADQRDDRIPDVARVCLEAFGALLGRLKAQILEFDRQITAWHRSNEMSRRLDELPGVGPALATALVPALLIRRRSVQAATSRRGSASSRSRTRAGGRELGSITKQGDRRYLRSLFTAGALAVIRYAKIHGSKHRPWLAKLLERRPTKVAAIALANKLARMAWAMMATGERYREPLALAR